MADWGRYLEDELVDVVAVSIYAVAQGPVDTPTEELRGRQPHLQVILSKPALDDYVAAHWFPDRAMWVRQLPALRFDTVHGSVVVADAWDDTGFNFLRRNPGRQALRLHTPLLEVAGHIRRAERTLIAGEFPTFLVVDVGWAETVPLSRARLRTYSSMRVTGWEGYYVDWAEDQAEYDSKAVRATTRAFRATNSVEKRDEARAQRERARTLVVANGGLDVQRGIAAIERFLSEEF